MDVVRLSIARPVTVAVAVILVVMFGLIGLGAIPIQLTPTVDRPIVRVTTRWAGRSPEEVVDEITKEQEEVLKNVESLDSMRSVSREGASEITLEFHIGVNIDRARQDVSDALRQVPDYPPDVDEPEIASAQGAAESAITWIILDIKPGARARHRDFDITTLYDALDKQVRPYLERVQGVAEVNIFGGREREVRLLLDPIRLAQRDLTPMRVIRAIQDQNRNTSAGSIAEGKRDYRVRVLGRYSSTHALLDTAVAYRNGKPVYVRDVGEVEISYQKRRGFVRSLGAQSIAINAVRQTGSNVMEVMSGIRGRLDEIRREVLPRIDPVVGPDLRLRMVYDETTYIASAIHLVRTNLWVGGTIAALVLLLFLRSFISTSVIVLAIPISVIGTFLVLLVLGRTLNVISLAGLAFSVGMVVDNAIVVLENIYRRLQGGEPASEAALRGGREVWGAILASTLTTVAVFVPILTIQEEAGQLFRDIALAIVASVVLSLVVSITVIPAACSRWLRPKPPPRNMAARAWRSALGLAPALEAGVGAMARLLRWFMSGWRGWTLRPAIIIAMTWLSLAGAQMLAPPLDYLPAGNRNLVFGGLLIPPGYSVKQMEGVAERIEAKVEPYIEADVNDPASVAALDPIPRRDSDVPFDPVPIENFFIGSFNGGMFVGATSQDPRRVLPIGALVTEAMKIPDSYGGASQASVFGRGVGGGNTIRVEVSGPDLSRVVGAAGMMFAEAGRRFGFTQIRAEPSNFNLQQQEWRLEINDTGRKLGLTSTDLGVAVRGLVDGVLIGDYQLDGDTVDLVALPSAGRLTQKEALAQVPIATPAGRVVPLDVVATITPALAPQQILRLEEQPAVSIQITPPSDQPLEAVTAHVRDAVIAPARQAGLIDPTMRVRLEGTAAKLDDVKASLFGSAHEGEPAPWQRVLGVIAWILAAGGVGVGLWCVGRCVRGVGRPALYGSAGALLLGTVLGGLAMGVASRPELGTARAVWALVVTYLLMCALFESFTYPFVIMFSVPLAVVGGFAGLRIAHDWTMRDPTIAPQQLDVLTMLGFVILVGVVVNNAILIVHQALNFMRGQHGTEAMDPLDAIALSVRTRVRPIFMSTLTSVGGMMPLVLFPGAGSEMYRGLGSVVIGGLLVSTIFTLVLVPLLFSLVLEMRQGFGLALARGRRGARVPTAPRRDHAARRAPSEPVLASGAR